MPTSAEAAEVLRISQRASTSCSECSRRKTRCDKQVPCDQCVKRGKAELCHRVPHVRPKDAEKIRQAIAATPLHPAPTAPTEAAASRQAYPTYSSSPSELGRASVPLPGLDTLAVGAFSEVAEMRAIIAKLQDRLHGLEGILSGVFERTKQEETSPVMRNALPSSVSQEPWLASLPTELQGLSPQAPPHPTSFPYGEPSGLVSSAFSPTQAYNIPDLHNTTLSLPPLQEPFASPPTAATVELHHEAQDVTQDAAHNGQSAATDPRWEKLREEEVAASLSLEFLALGRHHMDSGATVPRPQLSSLPATASIFDVSGLSPHPLTVYPNAAALARILPPFSDCERIVSHTLDWTAWLHGAVHGPTFRAEVQEFWAAPAETRLETANPAWLALFFAQLCCGLRHSTREQLQHLGPYGLSDEDVQVLSKAHFDAALSCLYRSHFLDNRQLHAVQAVAVLVIGCQDGAFSNVFPSLLSLGIAMGQDLGFHRLPSDEAWAESVAGQPLEQRVQSLIAFETKKRVFWALTSEDWFSIHHRRMSTVQPTQVTTPLPSNAHDEDFLTGIIVDRPPSEYTVTSKLLIWIQLARILQQAFQHLDDHPQPSYSFILELDKRMRAMLDRMPSWLTSPEAPIANLPPNSAWVRNAFIISSNHKVLVLHRAFFLRYETSRKRAIEASRRILREAAHCGDTRMWTVPYHISAAASVICLDLFQRSSPVETLRAERAEVEIGLATLRSMASFSGIASRGTALIQNLLEEEAKLPPLETANEARPGKRRRLSEAPTDIPVSHAAPRHRQEAAATLQTGPSAPSGFLPTVLLASPSSSATAQTPALDPFLNFDTSSLMPTTATLTDSLPAEFVSAFLDSGFDPLDGAITALQDFNWPALAPTPALVA
ncbi:hypothetical protein B0A53_02370 [Rhodotorula sp. CCFEE 5036]|nr:hypothetical protein B0A53_02370 [Rhodotorula sp. CCFEE 5036]